MGIVTGTRTAFRATPGLPVAALIGGGLAVLGAVASLLHLDQWGLPLCVFKAATGIPCLTCGGTRAVVRLANLDPLGALMMNPVVALAFLVLVPWAVADAVLALRRRSLVLEVGPGLGQALRWIAVPVLAANWAFLIIAGR
jgi:hypothetical protein